MAFCHIDGFVGDTHHAPEPASVGRKTTEEDTETVAQHSASNPNTRAFLECMERTPTQTEPYPHWLLEKPITDATCSAIAELPFNPPENQSFNGKRETNNATRVYFNKENCEKFEVCRDVVETFKDPSVITAIEKKCGIDLSEGQLRIEYCQDTNGFWLESHTDIFVKLFTMLIYLDDDPKLADCGTDVFDENHEFVKRAPYGLNKGMIFIAGENTWHGFSPRTIDGVRKSIIVNYVTKDWKDTYELA